MMKAKLILLLGVLMIAGGAASLDWASFPAAQSKQDKQSVDLVIRNGRVMDPETGTDAVLAVAVNQGRIVALGEEADQLNGRRDR